ncbi:a5aceaec-27c6-4d0a-8295-c87c12c090fc [Sclerotinia trifoliorum]|uniref:A5aceaec-27c6-4d0a-8295-c87c12c090fc n=1 Tax=Sclerotinia trifoliorum TaxID=28548 RepID=A0A8H2ZW91_9HELO|nr:a5aceaec-27c6-4d0a-8295-c87c12c090fc [Sclerotinia trifoliorum]
MLLTAVGFSCSHPRLIHSLFKVPSNPIPSRNLQPTVDVLSKDSTVFIPNHPNFGTLIMGIMQLINSCEAIVARLMELPFD